MSVQDVLKEAREKMEKSLSVMKESSRGVRGGRATAGLVESVMVSCYGSQMRLKEVAVISTPDPRTLVVKPFDPSVAGEIEKAIQKSQTGLTPQNDGKIIRLSVPPLSEERRKQLVTQVKKLGENAKVSLRNIRHEALAQAEKLKKDGTPEDEVFRLKDKVHEAIKEYEKKVDEVFEGKKKEILEE
ncbi:MAG: ribosome recycling factor [Planctomycetes bacterium]|nr:ribosome recycling factor [Planctomycetota bacterium]